MNLITEVSTDIVIEIQTINDRLRDFDCLFQILRQANEGQSEVILDFSKCYFLRQTHVRNYHKNPNLSSDKALKWAFQPGTTTRSGEVTGGVGLDFLKQFVNLNQGKLEIFSHDGYAIIDKGKESYQVRQTFFEGTLVNITLKCDESYYYLECNSDLDDQLLF